MGRRVVINQSNYLPWKGYFDLIHDADVFIFLDDVQFTKNDWRNRNRIYGPNGPHWLTIPVGPDLGRKVSEVPLPGGPWRAKHSRSIQQAYGRAPHFDYFWPFLDEVYRSTRWSSLSELNQYLTRGIARDFLGIAAEFRSSAEFGVQSAGQERVLGLLRSVEASTYVSGPAGRAYLDEEAFARAGIELVWKDYSGYPEYPQVRSPYVPEVSIVDLLFCTGPRAADHIWGWRGEPALSRQK